MRNDDGADYRAGYTQKFRERALLNIKSIEYQRKIEESCKKEREKERIDKIIEYCQPKIVEILDQAIDVLFQKQEEAMKDLRLHFDNENKKLLRPYERVERRLCAVFHVTPKEIRSHRRNKEIMLARQAVMYWTVRLTGYSFPKIGQLMGERDHTSIMSGVTAYRQKREKMGRYLRKAR